MIINIPGEAAGFKDGDTKSVICSLGVGLSILKERVEVKWLEL